LLVFFLIFEHALIRAPIPIKINKKTLIDFKKKGDKKLQKQKKKKIMK